MPDTYPVIVTGVRGNKSVEIDADVSDVPWSIGLDRDATDEEVFAEVITDLAARVSEEVGRELDQVPSSTRVGWIRVNNVGAWDFSADVEQPDFGDLQPQTGGQETFGDGRDDDRDRRRADERARSSQTQQQRDAERDPEQMDLMTAGKTDRFDAPPRPDREDRRDRPDRVGPASGQETQQTGQAGLDQFTADREQTSEDVREKGLDGQNFEDSEQRAAAAEDNERDVTKRDALRREGLEPDVFERVVYASGRGEGTDRIQVRTIGIDDSVIAGLVSLIEREIGDPGGFEGGTHLGNAFFNDAGTRLMDFEISDDVRDMAADDTPDQEIPDPEDPPDGWEYAPASRGGGTVDRWVSEQRFQDTPVALVTIDSVTDGDLTVNPSTLSAASLRQGRTVYNKNPQLLPDDVMRSINLPIGGRDQALLRAFRVMRQLPVQRYMDNEFGSVPDVIEIDGGPTIEIGDVIEIEYDQIHGDGRDSISGRVVSFDVPGGPGVILTRSREWDMARREVRKDGTAVGRTSVDGPQITMIQKADGSDPDDNATDEQATDDRLDELIDEVSEAVDGFGPRQSADNVLFSEFEDAGLTQSVWTERQSQDVFRHGIAAEDFLQRWRDNFGGEDQPGMDEFGSYVEVLAESLPGIIMGAGVMGAETADHTPHDESPGVDSSAVVDDRDPVTEASNPLDIEPHEMPEPGEFSLRSREQDRVDWIRTTDEMRQRQGISEGGGVKTVPVEGRQRISVQKLLDTGWQIRRGTEYFHDGEWTQMGRPSTIAEVDSDAFSTAIEMAVDEMESRSGTEYGQLPIGPDFSPDERTFDEFGGGA